MLSSSSIQTQLDQGLLVKHSEFWFFDGSLILRVQSTLFRVHISQLCRKLVLFRDMFSVPQPSECEEASYNGCPVLDLHDNAEDVANLMKVIYDGAYFGNNDRDDFAAVSGVVRLSNKYVMEEKIRAKAYAHICIPWPSTLKAWDAREDLARTYEVETGNPRGFRYANPIAVINLAREIDADELLPAAFYELSRYSFAQIFEPSPGDPLEPPPPSSSPYALSHTLSPSDMQRLALGKEAAQHAVTALIQNMEHASVDRSHRRSRSGPQSLALGAAALRTGRRSPPGSRLVCTTPAACKQELGELIELATQHYLFDRERGCADPLYVAEELGQLKSAEFSDCAACAHALEAWAAKERERLWRTIPDWFRLRR